MKKNKRIAHVSQLITHQLIATENAAQLDEVAKKYAVAITPTMLDVMNPANPNDPIIQQFVPTPQELKLGPTELKDPIGDEPHQKVKGIIHRYPDRCLLNPLHVCAVYCRFCFRREKVGPLGETLTKTELNATFDYIAHHPEIWEVILSGGDPFLLKPKLLEEILENLSKINHVEVIRFHTRVPLVSPNNITPEFIHLISSQAKTIYVVLHANHPNEFTENGVQAIKSLIDAGIPMLSQTVLLKGINDNIETLSGLMKRFIKHRIKPYYLHHLDRANGTQHFRVSLQKGRELMRALRGRFSGLCQPQYVVDLPGGHGKVPVGPNYLTETHEGYCLEDYQAQVHLYQDDILQKK